MVKEKQFQVRSADLIGMLELQTLLETFPLLITVYWLVLFQEKIELKKMSIKLLLLDDRFYLFFFF